MSARPDIDLLVHADDVQIERATRAWLGALMGPGMPGMNPRGMNPRAAFARVLEVIEQHAREAGAPHCQGCDVLVDRADPCALVDGLCNTCLHSLHSYRKR